MKFNNRQMVQSSFHSNHCIRTGGIGCLTRGEGAERKKEEDQRNQASHNSSKALSGIRKDSAQNGWQPHITQGASLASASLKAAGLNSTASSGMEADRSLSAARSPASSSRDAWVGSVFTSSRRIFPSAYLNRNVCFSPPPLSESTRKVRPDE